MHTSSSPAPPQSPAPTFSDGWINGITHTPGPGTEPLEGTGLPLMGEDGSDSEGFRVRRATAVGAGAFDR